ncbi:MAG: transglycosylase SLT domain-containing protein [Myxococcota bacterium]
MEAADLVRAEAEAERFAAAHPEGRQRDAALMVVGMIRRDREAHNLASEAFAVVAGGSGPLAPYAAYYQAEQDQRRGRSTEAIRTCETYQRRWPEGPHAVDCLRIVALSHATLGNAGGARAAASAYDRVHPTSPISEQIELHLALTLADTDPVRAVPVLVGLAVNHVAALTGRVAEEQLARLAAAQVPGAEIPRDPASREARAVSLRESGRHAEAWAEFEALQGIGKRDPAVAAWVEEESERFGWRTHNWKFLDALYAEELQKTGDPRWAWQRFKVLGRDGRYDEASTLALQMQRRADSSRYWRRTEEDVGRSMLLAKRYTDARTQFDDAAERGGYRGRRASFEAGFASLMAGDAADAVERLGELVDLDRSKVLEARYWRARALRTLERDREAEADEAWILANEPWSWYASLVRQAQGGLPAVPPYARAGAWAGQRQDPAASAAATTLLERIAAPATPPPTRSGPVALASTGPAAGFEAWQWGLVAARPAAALPTVPSRVDPELAPPASYRSSAMFSPERGRKALADFADQFAKPWPELQAISDLSSVGLYDLSGPMLGDWYEAWRSQVRHRDRTARKLVGTAPEAWRQLFLTARDHHDTARDLYDSLETTPLTVAPDVWRLAYPLAHDRYVWSASHDYGLDPYLVLGLMRQESTYDSTARSRVGARGAMQIMPRTGHLLANLAHDVHFDAGDLEDPTVAVGYGIRYLGLLMERFDEVYPLAVASYNGGPFNVSSWLHAVGPDMPIDAFVEHIPYRETRDYVKKVSEGYAAYVALYGPPSAAVCIPPRPLGDRPEVVDF